MALPKDNWPSVVDVKPGDDRIQVPLFAFDDASGKWKRDGEGFLEDDAGKVIAESELAAIRGGAHQGGVTVCGKVSHFSFWNVDWPVADHQRPCHPGSRMPAAQ